MCVGLYTEQFYALIPTLLFADLLSPDTTVFVFLWLSTLPILVHNLIMLNNIYLKL